MSVLRNLFQYAGKHKYLTISSLILSAVSAIILLVPFICIWKVIEELFQVYPNYEQATHTIEYGWMAFLFSVAGILVYVAALMCSHLAAFRIASNMRKATMHRVMELPMGYLQREGSGKVRKTIDEASASTETYLAHQLPDMIQMFVTIFLMFILLFVFDWRFGVATLITLILALANMMKMMGKGLEASMKAYMDALDAMSNEAVEYVRGIPVVKTFQQTVYSFHRFHQTIKDYEKFAIGYTNQMRQPMTLFTTFINSIFIFLIGAVMLLLLNGVQVNEILLDFLFYVIFTPLIAVTTNKILFASENTLKAQDALNRIDSIMNAETFTYSNSKQTFKNYDIEFEHVSFHYPDSDEEVLKDISLKVPAGSTVAFVGASGGGKTTLVSLIPRFYDVSQGSIKIGGYDVKDISENELMEKISFVFQDSHLLKRSLYENVKMGRDVSEQEVLQALKDAQCDDIISKFPSGIHTIIGTKGTYVSGGEAQRLTVARAILKNSPILLLDEASAFADPDNEYKMQSALSRLSKGKTTIMIAHRLSTVKNADCIYVIDHGKIVESGTHQQLLKEKGMYETMWRHYLESVDWKIGSEGEIV